MSTLKRIWPFWLLVLTKVAILGGLFLVTATAGSVAYFEFGSPEQTCLSCHELRTSYDNWAHSAHRDVSCKECHGGTVTSGWHGAKENFNRFIAHFRDTSHDDMRLSEEQVFLINDKCATCHAGEAAHWKHGGHGTTYADIFLDEKHNQTELMADDCLRCHGMFFAGTVADLVEPVDVKGPWRLKDPAHADRPAIPCLACHEIHSAGQTAAERSKSTEQRGSESPVAVCLYSRREQISFKAADLPQPKIVDGDKTVPVSTDLRQRVCVQCHAPDAFGHLGSGDDRTPTGVHAGLSCLSCHDPHSNDARASCAECHPRMSNCGLDVTKMDTTFHSPNSKHNIHHVACGDCHTDGAAAKKAADTSGAASPSAAPVQ